MKNTFKPLLSNEKDIRKIRNRPAISAFKDNQSLGSVLENAYIEPRYYLRKCNKDRAGIESIYSEYNNCNIIFIGEGGTGKTTAFLHLYLGIDKNNTRISFKPFHYIFAPDLQIGATNLSSYKKP